MALARVKRYKEARDVFLEGAKLYPDQPRFTEMVAAVDAAKRNP
jgi:TolA-binding protein